MIISYNKDNPFYYSEISSALNELCKYVNSIYFFNNPFAEGYNLSNVFILCEGHLWFSLVGDSIHCHGWGVMETVTEELLLLPKAGACRKCSHPF